MQIFMLVGVSVIEILLFNRKKKKKQKKMKNMATLKISVLHLYYILQAFLDFFLLSLAFNMFPTLMLVEWKLKVKTEISIFP